MRRRYIITFVVALAVGVPARADILLSPGQLIGGMTQSQLADAWWQTMIQAPQSGSVIAGGNGGAVTFPSNPSVVFLTGASGQINGSSSGNIQATATVNSNQILFFPLLNSTSWNASNPALQNNQYAPTFNGARQDSAASLGFGATAAGDGTSNVNTNATLKVSLTQQQGATTTTLISETTADLLNYRQRSNQPSTGFFDIAIPANDAIFGPGGNPAGTVQAISDGWWAAIGPLAPGTYTLEFGGSTTGAGQFYGAHLDGNGNPVPANTNDQAIFYTVTVTPAPAPEPSSLILAGAAGLALVGRRVWNRKSRPSLPLPS